MVPIKDTNQPKWFNSTIRHKIKCLGTLKRKHNRHPTNNTMLKVTNLQEELQSMIAEAKSEFESNLALTYAHTNNNKIFQYISSIKGHDRHPNQMFYNKKKASTDSEKTQLFNDYFYSVFSSSDQPINDFDTTPSSDDSLHDIVMSQSDVFDIFTSLDANKASGIDNISPKIFKHCAAPLLQVICHLFSTSLQNNSIPQERRIHCVTSIYKAGDKSSVSNYRPISLLYILSKVLERIVYNNIIRHVQGKLTEHQFGFLPNRSTLQQLLLFSEKLLEAKSKVDVVYMDFRKAFDSVSHNGLLNKLYTIGITGKLWKWFQEYLLQRFQCVRIGDS